QFQVLRSIGNITLLVLIAWSSKQLPFLKPTNWKPVYFRAFMLLICMFFFFAGAPFLSLPQMAAGLYTYPLFISLLAAPVLGEKVGPWRIAALFIGGCGALFVLSPWSTGFSFIQVLPVIAGFFYACNILTIRKACRSESPMALALAAGLTFVVFGLIGITLLTFYPLSETIQSDLPFIAIGWPTLTMLVLGFAILTSFLNLTGNICLSRAYQTADASWLAPIDFVYLIFAAFWSRIMFDQWPTSSAAFGILLIASAGILTAWRERVKNQQK
ncbi:MAG: drug/metabolite transporter (DMT)-like permease, partial [Gammaproteobacteria bacterium]